MCQLFLPLYRLVDYSCAFVADILLQGHLYITPNYFAFYSNVFGYVTKLLIPVISVTRISKEKTAKIFPNAICILVSDDKFVFGSFLSREAAFKLMNSIWQALPRCQLELNEINTVLKPNAEVEVSECSMEEESSCSFSSSDQGGGSRSKLPISIFSLPNTKLKAPTSMQDKPRESKLSTPTSSSCTTLNTTTPPSIISGKAAEVKHFDRILFRLTLLLGLLFAISLAIFSTYLMWRIHEMEQKTNSALKFHDNLDQYTDKVAMIYVWVCRTNSLPLLNLILEYRQEYFVSRAFEVAKNSSVEKHIGNGEDFKSQHGPSHSCKLTVNK